MSSGKSSEAAENLWHLRLQEKEKLPCLYQRGAGMVIPEFVVTGKPF